MRYGREKYCFVPWRQISEEEGWEPALPEEVEREFLAAFGYDDASGRKVDALYVVSWPEEDPDPPGIRPVSDDLKNLLMSGRKYPPALAIARGVRFQKGAKDWSAEEEVQKFTAALRAELDQQHERRFFLAKAREEVAFSGYKIPGQYYWIVDYRPQKKWLSWVSSDYFVYIDPVTDFDVDLSWLAERIRGFPPLDPRKS